MTTGLIAAAGCTPALSARQPGGAFALRIASDITLRKVFSTQTKRTTPINVVNLAGEKSISVSNYVNPAAALTSPRCIGDGLNGLDFNSGWNCEATK